VADPSCQRPTELGPQMQHWGLNAYLGGGNRLIANLPALMPLRTLTLNSGPFPPPALPGFDGTAGLSATPGGPACPSRESGRESRTPTAWGFPCCLGSPVPTCRRHYPGGIVGFGRFSGCDPPFPRRLRPSPFLWRVVSHIIRFEACSAFTHVTACPLAGSLNDPFHRRLRRSRYLHRRSDCYRLERPELPGGGYTR